MTTRIIGQDWPPVKHNIPIAEPEDPPPFGTRHPCAGCGLPAPRGSRWCATCRADVPAPEPRSTRHLDANRAWMSEVETRRRLTALELGLCPTCERPVGDTLTEIWHPACAPERGM